MKKLQRLKSRLQAAGLDVSDIMLNIQGEAVPGLRIDTDYEGPYPPLLAGMTGIVNGALFELNILLPPKKLFIKRSPRFCAQISNMSLIIKSTFYLLHYLVGIQPFFFA